jgi:outer membrane autotransporter protein
MSIGIESGSLPASWVRRFAAWVATVLLVMVSLPALALCDLSIDEESPSVGVHGSTIQLTPRATDASGCESDAEFSISVDPSSGLIQAREGTFSEVISVMLPMEVGEATLEIRGTENSASQFTHVIRSEKSPPLSVYNLLPGSDSPTDLSGENSGSAAVFVTEGGKPGSSEAVDVCFEIIGPDHGVRLVGGTGPCGGKANGRLQPSDISSGNAEVTVVPDGALCSHVEIKASATFPDGFYKEVPLRGQRLQMLSEVSGDGQAAFVDQPFDEPLVVQLTCGDTPVANRNIRWFLKHEPEGTVIDGSDVVATDEEGMAQVKLIAGSQTGSFSVRSALSFRPDDGEGIRDTPHPGFQVKAIFDDLVVQNFYELEYEGPAELSGPVGSELELGVRLSANGDPALGREIIFALLSGPEAAFGNLESDASVFTDETDGTAIFTFVPDVPGTWVVEASFEEPSSEPESEKKASGPSPLALQFKITVTVAGAELVFVSQPETPIYTDETTPDGVVVQAREVDGEGFVGETGVTVTFDIISGTAAFVGGSAQAMVVTDEVGYAESPAIEVGLGSSDIVIQASAGGVEPVDFTLPVTLSTYVLRLPDGTPDPIVGTAGSSIPLAVVLARTGSGPTVPMSGEEITWDNSGGTLAAPTSLTGASGVAVNSISSLIPDTYTVIPQFIDEAFGGDYPQISITVQIDAATATLDIVSGDAQSALPGEALSDPLVVRALNGGNPPTDPIDINWTIAPLGAAIFETTPSSTGETGLSSVTVTLSPNAQSGQITITASRADSGDEAVFTAFVQTAAVTSLAVVSGDNQAALAGQSLPLPLVVVAADDNEPPLSPIGINWTVAPQGAATLAPLPSSTDPQTGEATITVTFAENAQPGQVTITATRADTGDQAQFSAVVLAPTVTALTAVSGSGQAAEPGQSLALPLVVVANNNNEPPLSPVTIAWTTSPPGKATFAPVPSVTDPQTGQASVTVTLTAEDKPPGSPNEEFFIVATRSDSGDQATFQATMLAPVLKTLVKPQVDSGDGQSAPVGSQLPLPLQVLARDNDGGASGVTINWSVTGDAALSAAQTVTDTSGASAVGVTFGNNAGVVTVVASRQDAPAASTSFVLTAEAVPVAALQIIDGDGQSGLINQPAQPLRVRYSIDGVPQAGIPVSWTVQSGAATLPQPSGTTAADGTASVDLEFGAVPGPIVVRAQSGDAFADFGLNAVAGFLGIESGNAQSAAAGTTLPQDFVARVSVPGGASVSLQGLAVTWEIVEGAGSLVAGTVSTDAAGLAANRLTLGAAAGNTIVRASIDGGSAVQFIATSVGPALTIVGGNAQRGPMQTPGDTPLAVALLTADGRPLTARTVQWQVLRGPVVLDAGTSQTDAAGRATVNFRYGDTPGTAVVRASSAEAAGFVDFSLESLQAALMGAASGNAQSGRLGRELPEDFVVSIAPPDGKALGGVTVFWQVIEGGGTLRSATSLTDAAGIARNRLTLGPELGTNRVVASIPGGGQVLFTAEAVAPAGTLRIISGNAQTLPTNEQSAPLVVEVVDANGVPLDGVRVRWTGLASQPGGSPGAEVADEVTVTNAQGRTSTTAKVLLPGSARVEARAVDAVTTPVVFDLSGGIANIAGLNEGQRETSNAIDNACPALAALPNRTAAQEDLYRRCLELTNNAGNNPDEVRHALDQIPSDLGDSMVDAAFGALGAQFSNHSQRFEVLRKNQAGGKNQFNIALWTPTGVLPLSFLPSAIVAASDDSNAEVGSEFDRWGFFATGTIGRGKSRGLNETPGFEFDTSGITAGVDYRFSDRLVGGVSVGYARNDSEIRGGDGSVETRGWTVSGYASWFNDRNWYVDGVLSYGSSDYSLDRALSYTITALGGGRTVVDQRARGDTDGSLLGTSVSLGRDFQKGPWNFSTYLRGNYSRIELDGYEERMLAGLPGAGLALRFDSRTLNSVTSALGGKATWVLSRDWGVLMPHAQVEWEHEFRDSPADLVARFAHDPTNTPIATTGSAVDTDYFNVGVGVSALFPGGRSVYVYYEQLMGASRLSQGTLSIGGRFEF